MGCCCSLIVLELTQCPISQVYRCCGINNFLASSWSNAARVQSCYACRTPLRILKQHTHNAARRIYDGMHIYMCTLVFGLKGLIRAGQRDVVVDLARLDTLDDLLAAGLGDVDGLDPRLDALSAASFNIAPISCRLPRWLPASLGALAVKVNALRAPAAARQGR